ncbi:MAG: hypothetical protein WCI05_15845 [Myxococcales bacterium]
MRSVRRLAWLVAILTVGLIGITALREHSAGAEAWERSERALAKGDRMEAVRAAGRAASAFVPGGSFSELGCRRLETLAREAEVRGDDQTALAAWRTLRAAVVSTRAMGIGRESWRRLADEGVVRIAVHAGGEQALRSGALSGALSREWTPSSGAFAALALAVALFLGGAARAVWVLGEPGELPRVAAGLVALGLLMTVVVLWLC